ncbi:naphthalene 1,2-dioxygenase [Burkholderia sp. HB1]|nr:naphthalene 1,2-dioxygenase [Burkholderia sp. HB1]
MDTTHTINFIDVEHGRQSHKIYQDQTLFELECERIFARCWLFLTHECAIPNYGDFVTTRMGTDEVIVMRQKDNSIKAFLNVCRHRGARLCAVEAGNARGFACNYHGWAYGADGSLLSVPFENEIYQKRLDKCKNGLHEIGKVESYHGFVYGCFDTDAPNLKEYLGDFAWYLDLWMEAGGGIELVGPPARCFIEANWKAPSENFVGDAYHVGWTHASALRSGQSGFAGMAGNNVLPPAGAGLQVTTRHGHGIGALYDVYAGVHDNELSEELMAWGLAKEQVLKEKIGSIRARLYRSHLNGTIFPNTSFLTGSGVFKVWQPHGPKKTEVLTWAMVEKDMPRDMKERISRSVQRTFGIAGYWETEDNDNMESETHMGRGFMAGKKMLNSQMGISGDRQDPDYPGIVGDSAVGETSYRGYYRFYNALIQSSNWEEVNARSIDWVNELITARPEK